MSAQATAEPDAAVSGLIAPPPDALPPVDCKGDIARVWVRAQTGSEGSAPNSVVLTTIVGRAPDALCAVTFSNDGTLVATGSHDNTASVFHTNCQAPMSLLKAHRYETCALSFASDDSRLFTGSWDAAIRAWPRPFGKQSTVLVTIPSSPNTGVTWDKNTLAIHPAASKGTGVHAISVSPDGTFIAESGLDRVVGLYDAKTGRVRARLQGSKKVVHSVAFSRDGKLLASGGGDGRIRVWDVSGLKLLRELGDSEDIIFSVAFLPDSTRIVAGLGTETEDDAGNPLPIQVAHNRVVVWDVAQGKLVGSMTGHTDFVYAVAVPADGEIIASGGLDHTIRIWDTSTGKLRFVLADHTEAVLGLAFAPRGRLLASVSGRGRIQGEPGFDNRLRLFRIP